MERLKLKYLLIRAEAILRDKKYSEDTIQDYKYVWNRFYNICELCDIEYFNLELAMKFLEKYYHVDTKNGKGKLYTRRMCSIYILDSVDKNNPIKIYRPKIEKKIPKEFNDIFYEYDNYLKSNYSYSTRMTSEKILADFFHYLKENNITSIDNIQIQNIYNFVNSINTQKYSKNTIYEIKYKLKKFFKYLYDNHKYKFDGIDIFPKIAKFERSKLPSYYTIDEINQILKQVDRSTKRGKRDFAILLLSIVYGLRNSDIVHLKKENILWNENKIELIQYKTKKLLELPLTENVKYALLDYLKNARPNIDSPYIFLPTKPPYTYIDMKNYSSLYKSAEQYIKKAGIDIGNRKRGLHSLRHSLASNMLKNNIEISTISGILGHSSIDVTNIYLSISEEQLRNWHWRFLNMNNNNFIGPFKNIAPLYIEYKRSLGFNSESEYNELKRLDKYFYNKGITEVILTKDMVEEYGMLRENESPRTQAKRLSILKQFTIYLQKMGYPNIYVHHIMPSKSDSKFKPYIYSEHDLNIIFNYLDKHQYDTNSIFNCVLPILIRILYGTGLRRGEAINLKNTDVNLDKRIITIYNGKENVTRIVPISESLSESCKTYKSKFLCNEHYFLCDLKGNKINSHITEYFQKILKKLNILRPDNTPPRLHDFRFTFAVNALEKMDKNGQDLYTTLPILCKYLGHKNIEATEYYLLLAKDYFINITDKEEKYYSDFKFLKDDDNE